MIPPRTDAPSTGWDTDIIRASFNRSVAPLVTMLVALCLPSCRVANLPTAPAAAVFGATAVGAAAVRRSHTGGCWANCSKGWHCDERSGLCQQDDEMGGERATTQRAPLQRAMDAALGRIEQPAAAVLLSVGSQEVLAQGARRGADVAARAHRPGSTVKPLLALLAIEAGVLPPGHRVSCAGTYPAIEGFTCHGHHGQIGLAEALETSCNVYFYDVAARLGYERLVGGFAALGFARPDARSDERERDWPGWAPLVGTGHGPLEVTLLQLAQAYAQLARKLTPADAGDAGTTDPVLDELRDGLWRVVQGDQGTGQLARVDGLEIAGKTGTAEAHAYTEEPAADRDSNGWFVGYAPAAAPEVVVAVLVVGGGSGGQSAAPVAADVLQSWVQSAP